MNKYAILIGLEHYAEKFPQVMYAENDATVLQTCLIDLGYDPRDVTCLKSLQATKARIESELHRIVSLSQDNDEVLLFFAGHGVSMNGSNYVTCRDTVQDEPVNSCIQMRWILELLKTSRATRNILFLDPCHSGPEAENAMPGPFRPWGEDELDAYFSDAQYDICFASSSADELSYSSPNLRHGLWTYHLIEALKGKASSAVKRDLSITNTSLQNFLEDQIPRTLRIENPAPVAQTPRCFGQVSHESPLFDVTKVLARNKAECKARLMGINRMDMLGSKGHSIRKLIGFRKGYHRIPDTIDKRSQGFVQGIASVDVRHEATQLYESLKSNFKYKRKEIQLSVDGGSADIATRDFDLSVTYAQAPERATDYTVEYLITNVRDLEALDHEGLQRILNHHFDEVRFSFEGEIHLEEIIDAIEATEPEGMSIHYPADCSSLKIVPAQCQWSINMSPRSLSIANHSLESPATMLKRLKESQGLISHDAILNALLA